VTTLERDGEKGMALPSDTKRRLSWSPIDAAQKCEVVVPRKLSARCEDANPV